MSYLLSFLLLLSLSIFSESYMIGRINNRFSLYMKKIDDNDSSTYSKNNYNLISKIESNKRILVASLLGFCLPTLSFSSTLLSPSSSNSMIPIASAQETNKGGKGDKVFELCLSKCIFSETRPPPVGASTDRLEVTIPRVDIIRGCKTKCAISPQQLLLGTPKQKKEDAPLPLPSQ